MKVVEVKTRMLTPASETSSAPLAGVRASGMSPPLSTISRRAVVASSSTVPFEQEGAEDLVTHVRRPGVGAVDQRVGEAVGLQQGCCILNPLPRPLKTPSSPERRGHSHRHPGKPSALA